MLKMFVPFLMTFSVIGYSETVAEKIIEVVRDLDKDEQFDYLSQEIAQLDRETLEQNPELLFRKALLAFDGGLFFDRFANLKRDVAQDVLEGFQFAAKHAESDSVFYRAAEHYGQLMNRILQEQHFSAILYAMGEYRENRLRKWASNPELSGDELRWDIFNRWNAAPEKMSDFLEYVLISSGEVDLMLGRITPSECTFEGVEDGALICEIEYSPLPTRTVSLTFPL